MKPFPSFQGSRACFFSDLFTSRYGEAGLRIPFDRLRAAVSPIPKLRKEQRPPASLSRNDFMVSPEGEIHRVQRYPLWTGLLSLGEITSVTAWAS
jgi:hypothetical protein